MSSQVAIHANPQEATTFTSRRRPLARHFVTAARVLTGLSFLVFGLDGFLHFIPKPTTGIPEGALAFGTALFQTGYMFPLIKGTEVLAAVLLLSNRFVPLALLLLAPVVVNIVAFHAFLAPDGIAVAGLHAVLVLYLAWAHRKTFAPVLASRAQPSA